MKHLFFYAVLLLFVTTADAACRKCRGEIEKLMTLQFEGLPDGQSKEHLSTPLEILAWSWGAGTTERDESGKKIKTELRVQDISLTKYAGTDSPHIMKMIASKEKVPTVTLKAVNQNEIVMVLKNARITHLSTGGSGGEDRFTENITIASEEIGYLATVRNENDEAKSSSASIKNPEK